MHSKMISVHHVCVCGPCFSSDEWRRFNDVRLSKRDNRLQIALWFLCIAVDCERRTGFWFSSLFSTNDDCWTSKCIFGYARRMYLRGRVCTKQDQFVSLITFITHWPFAATTSSCDSFLSLVRNNILSMDFPFHYVSNEFSGQCFRIYGK